MEIQQQVEELIGKSPLHKVGDTIKIERSTVPMPEKQYLIFEVRDVLYSLHQNTYCYRLFNDWMAVTLYCDEPDLDTKLVRIAGNW